MERVKQGGGIEVLEGFQGKWGNCWVGLWRRSEESGIFENDEKRFSLEMKFQNPFITTRAAFS